MVSWSSEWPPGASWGSDGLAGLAVAGWAWLGLAGAAKSQCEHALRFVGSKAPGGGFKVFTLLRVYHGYEISLIWIVLEERVVDYHHLTIPHVGWDGHCWISLYRRSTEGGVGTL